MPNRWPQGYRPEHGTWHRYKWELRHGQKACPECTEAWRQYYVNYRAEKKTRGRTPTPRCDPTTQPKPKENNIGFSATSSISESGDHYEYR